MSEGQEFSSLERPCIKCGTSLTTENIPERRIRTHHWVCQGCMWALGQNEKSKEHRRVMAETLGVPIEVLKGRDVHHIDENPENNSRKNLLLLARGAHRKLHGKKGRKLIWTTYLAGPIDGVSSDTANTWRNEAYDTLAQNAIISLVPGRERRGLLNTQEIVDIDRCMIEKSDAVLVNLQFLVNPELGRGSGTLVELGFALACQIPIIAFVDQDLGTNKFVQGLCSYVAPSQEEATEVLISINKGAR